MAEWTSPLVYDRIVVTGGGSGAGRATALALAAAGATVYVTGRRSEPLDETQGLAADARGHVVPVVMDVTDEESTDRGFMEIEAHGGPVPGLVHCAAVVEYRPAKDMEPALFQKVVESVLFGTYTTLHRWAAPLLESGTTGVAVAMTSAIATRGTPGAAASSSGKAGVEALFRTVAREWGPLGLRLNVVGPGFYVVDRTSEMWADDHVSQPVREAIALKRPGRVEEIVGPIMFLLSEAAGYITGEVIVPDGGFRLTPHVLPRLRFEKE